jgi:hypothetical protein
MTLNMNKPILIVDLEGPTKRLVWVYPEPNLPFDKALDKFRKEFPQQSKKDVIQYVNAQTGESIKGPKFNTTEKDMDNNFSIQQRLWPGVKYKEPIDPMQTEPRDRFQEVGELGNQFNPSHNYSNKYKKQIVIQKEKQGFTVTVYNQTGTVVFYYTAGEEYNKAVVMANALQNGYKFPVVDVTKQIKENMKTNIISQLVKECIDEKQAEKEKTKQQLKESLRKAIKKVLIEMNSSIPTETEDKEETEKVQKQYNKKGNERINKGNGKLFSELERLVNGIDENFEVILDDNDDFTINARELGKVRICPRWENNFDIEFYTKMQDRVRVIGATWEQAKDFVKANLKPDAKTKVDTAYNKSIDHLKDREVIKKSAGPDNDIVKNRLEDPEHTKLKDTKKDDMDYKEKQVKKDEDQPDQPMKQVTEPGKDPEGKNKNIKETTKVKPSKHKNDKKLIVKDKKTPKFKR